MRKCCHGSKKPIACTASSWPDTSRFTILSCCGLCARQNRQEILGMTLCIMKQFSFSKEKRLVSNSQFQDVLARGRRLSDGRLILCIAENNRGHSRLGVSVGKSQGNAVIRNRLKRLVREAFRQSQKQIPAGFDYVVMIAVRRPNKKDASEKVTLPTFEQIRNSFLTLVRRYPMLGKL